MQQIDSIGTHPRYSTVFFSLSLPSSVPVSFSFSPRSRFDFFSISFGFAKHLYESIVCCSSAMSVVLFFYSLFCRLRTVKQRVKTLLESKSSCQPEPNGKKRPTQLNSAQHEERRRKKKPAEAAAAVTTAHQTAK